MRLGPGSGHRSLRQDSTHVAALYLITTVAGFLRDVFVVRAVGFGASSDSYFLLAQLPIYVFGLAGQATYLPIALADLRAARLFKAVLLACAAVGTAAIVAASPVEGERLILLFCLLGSYIWMLRLADRFVVAAKRGALRRLAAIQLAATGFFMIALALGDGSSVIFVVAVYALSLPLATWALLPSSRPATPAVDQQRAKAGSLTAYVAVSVLQQALPVLERLAAAAVGVGAASALAIGGKLSNLPAGLVGYAVGTTLLVHIASGNSQASLVQIIRRRATVACAVTVIATAASVLVAYLAFPLIAALFGISAGDESARTLVALSFITVGTTAVFSAINQETLARRRWRVFVQANITAVAIAMVAILCAVVLDSPHILPVGAFMAQAAGAIWCISRDTDDIS